MHAKAAPGLFAEVPATPKGQSRADPNDEMLTKAELADRLHKSVRCIELWMRRRYLPYFKVGRSVLFRWPDVVAALNRFRVG